MWGCPPFQSLEAGRLPRLGGRGAAGAGARAATAAEARETAFLWEPPPYPRGLPSLCGRGTAGSGERGEAPTGPGVWRHLAATRSTAHEAPRRARFSGPGRKNPPDRDYRVWRARGPSERHLGITPGRRAAPPRRGGVPPAPGRWPRGGDEVWGSRCGAAAAGGGAGPGERGWPRRVRAAGAARGSRAR